MPTYNNAIGYLIELRDEVNQSWFSKICDLAITSINNTLQDADFEVIKSIFLGNDNYTSILHPTSTSVAPITTSPVVEKINYITDFQNFKYLSSDLKLKLQKQVSIIFGANGTGKSSLCEALKILANTNVSEHTIRNLKDNQTIQPSFKYKVETDATEKDWNLSLSFGQLASKIKFFDNKLAVSYLNSNINPENAVEISPFKLYIFEYVRAFLLTFRDKISQLYNNKIEAIEPEINVFKNLFSNIKSRLVAEYVSNISHAKSSSTNLTGYLSQLPIIDYPKELNDTQKEVDKLKFVISDAGTKALKNEINDIKNWLANINKCIETISKLNHEFTISLLDKAVKLSAEQKELNAKINYKEIEFADFKEFLISTQSVFDLKNIEECPLCRRKIDDEITKRIFDEYYNFLNSSIEKDLAQTKDSINKEWRNYSTFLNLDFNSLIGIKTNNIKENIINDCLGFFGKIKSKLPKENSNILDLKVISNHEFIVPDAINKHIEIIKEQLTDKENLLKKITEDKSKITEQIENLKTKIEDLKFKQILSQNKSKFDSITEKQEEIHSLHEKMNNANFQGLLLKTTNRTKYAHNELVISDFTTNLDNEYYKLSEKYMNDFGVTLKTIGNEAVLNPNINNHGISLILSEGEQKVHSLALFFNELNISKEDIIVFDDPITSLDYNYTGAFVERLRDLVQNSDKQIIMFTHDWEFFYQMQQVFNQSGLNNKYELLILEDCNVIEQYSEKIDDLKNSINSYLSQPSISRDDKSKIAGNMRVLIETIVNEHVFNQQRYNYKRKNSPVSEFIRFTKLVPLTNNEATKLKDLFRRLSPWEHADPRTWYTTTDKTVFQNRLIEIEQIENDIIARK